ELHVLTRSGHISFDVQVFPRTCGNAQWCIVSVAHGFKLGLLFESLTKGPGDRGRLRCVVTDRRKAHLGDGHMLRIKTGLDRARKLEAADKKSGANQGDHREGYFGGAQEATHTLGG